MDYRKTHDAIIKRAFSRNYIDGYTEKHHVIPKSMGGGNDKSNLVTLTAREHYIIHWLLFKMHRNQEMAFAWHRMTHGKASVKRYVSHTFTYARKTRAAYVSAFLKGKSLTEKHKGRLSAAKSGKTYADLGRGESPLKGRKYSASHKLKISIANTGYRRTDESRYKISIAKLGEKNPMFGKKTPVSVAEKISVALKGRDMAHKREISRKNTSGVVGVSYSASRKKWCASINLNGLSIYLGRFNDFDLAADARRNAELKFLFNHKGLKHEQA